jgi:DNA-binding transcriptional MerR regulator
MIAPTITKDGAQIPRLALTTDETAAALGVRPTTIWRLAKRGLLVPNRATRRPLFAVSDIERFLQEGKA